MLSILKTEPGSQLLHGGAALPGLLLPQPLPPQPLLQLRLQLRLRLQLPARPQGLQYQQFDIDLSHQLSEIVPSSTST